MHEWKEEQEKEDFINYSFFRDIWLQAVARLDEAEPTRRSWEWKWEWKWNIKGHRGSIRGHSWEKNTAEQNHSKLEATQKEHKQEVRSLKHSCMNELTREEGTLYI